MEPRQPTRSKAARAKPIAPCGDLFADSLDERFQRFHRANPMVFDLFLRFTLQLKAQGRKHYSAKAAMGAHFGYMMRKRAAEFDPLERDRAVLVFAKAALLNGQSLGIEDRARVELAIQRLGAVNER